MYIRILSLVAAFSLSWGIQLVANIAEMPKDRDSFREILVDRYRPPGPLGYFNAIYMAFTPEEAKQFPNLVSMREKVDPNIKRGELKSKEKLSDPGTIDESNYQNKTRQINRGRKDKRGGTSYPVTTITGACQTATKSGLNRPCEVCPAMTDLGPGVAPRYINEVLCGGSVFCGIDEDVVGICESTSLNQDFLVFKNLAVRVYTQPIRSCCECSLFPL